MCLSAKIRLCLFPAVITLSFLLDIQAQGNPNYKGLIQKTNTIYGANDFLNSGEQYKPLHPRAKGSPYFLDKRYSPVSISVHGTTFGGILTKYDLVEGKLVILSSLDSNRFILIALSKDKVDSFRIQDHFFINISKYFPSADLDGYGELVYRGKKCFFIKYTKQFISPFDQYAPDGKYTKMKSSFYIFDGHSFAHIQDKKMFLRLFDDKKPLLRKYMRKNKIRFLKASTSQLNKLMRYGDEVSK